jgi:flagellar biosynthesis anti-sigma factor FlgM
MRIRPSENANIISQYSSNSKNSEATSNTQNTKASSDAKRPQENNNYESAAVSADISKDYDTYQKAVKEIKSQETESRNMKIQTLKKQIEEGTYEIEPQEIARSMMNSVMDKLG